MKYWILLCMFFFSPAHAASISGYELPELQVQSLGQASLIKIGRFTEIGRFQIKNPSRKTLNVRSVRLKNYGKSDLGESLERAGVYVNGEKISTGYVTQGRFIIFHFEEALTGGFQILGDDRVIVSVQAEVVYARRGDSIQLGLRRTEDLEVVEQNSGFQLPVAETFKLSKHQLNPGSLHFRRPSYQGYRRYRYSKKPRIGHRFDTVKKSYKTPRKSKKSFRNRYW